MFILYIYKSNGERIDQNESLQVKNVSRKINNAGSCDFTLELSDEIIRSEVFANGNIFDLFLNEDGVEKRLIKGVVKKMNITQNIASIKIEDLFYVLKRRFLRAEKSYTSKSYSYILDDIFSYINGISTTLTSVSSDVIATTSITFRRGASVFKILQDLSQNGYEFKIEDATVIFKELSGIDRTQNNSSYVEYILDLNEPYGANIDSVNLINNTDSFANGVIDEVSASSNIGTGELLLENYVNDTINRTSYINDHKEFLGDYLLGIKGQNFFESDIGDLVKIYIYSGNELLFFDGSMKVTEKTLTPGGLLNVAIKVSKNKVKIQEFFDQFEEMKLKIGKLET